MQQQHSSEWLNHEQWPEREPFPELKRRADARCECCGQRVPRPTYVGISPGAPFEFHDDRGHYQGRADVKVSADGALFLGLHLEDADPPNEAWVLVNTVPLLG
jgi:hypothetical protein